MQTMITGTVQWKPKFPLADKKRILVCTFEAEVGQLSNTIMHGKSYRIMGEVIMIASFVTAAVSLGYEVCIFEDWRELVAAIDDRRDQVRIHTGLRRPTQA